ncbi:Flagellar secretion chaperone FliS [Vibrio chagasii]|jgi:flagellar protein FliS|uniref:Flagellar secretion chaperone FliS n=1 Tax=Vibrio chagasii TaxID=170679 RepID=A0A7Y3YRA8_9VIBR|nr:MULTISPECIES: flagellar export chaperone FliS [Vibrio]NOH34293.1 flagellar export chaperone FliS [Vibrio chagasii]NOI37365.1 flagellar export chaperone FliS [Vibrio sp. 070316B]NOI84741.1 flagellar export chaperone FliS [Vibrio sp. 99K-1]CAH6819008.1 Flagellar secretion chaperone FliS [Vibrio chagasii]CAH6827493.1 Flagellar secretion chaperone FliS [Vibrio chagasii]
MLLGKQQQANYANVQVTANASVSSSFELICMLHERLIQELESVKFSIETKDLELKSKATQKSIDILVGLDASLDLSTGEELIQNIHALYEHAIATVFEASKEMNPELIVKLIGVVTDLKEGWEGAMEWLDEAQS